MIVYKKFNIESARSLPKLPKSHPCNQIHGHSFKIIISIKGDVDEKSGFVKDFQIIENAFKPLKKILDHTYLNDIKDFQIQAVKIFVSGFGINLNHH